MPKTNYYQSNRVLIIGHKHPDTDSICSALGYAWLKNQLGKGIYEARRAGDLNQETKFALEYFGLEPPRICEDVRPKVKDAEYRIRPGIDQDMSLKDAWDLMVSEELDTLCVTDSANQLLGIIAVKDIANANMLYSDTEMLSEARTPYANLLKTLDASLIVGDPEDKVEKGRICVGTSPEMMEEGMSEGDIVFVTNRYETQSYAVECGASIVIVCCGAKISDAIINRAKDKGCAVMTTPYNTYEAARLITMSVPVRYKMLKDNILTFTVETPIDEVHKVMASVRHRYFPILEMDGTYAGVISRRNLLNPHKKQVILVDHNEKSQAVNGLSEADVLEIVDHHRLGGLETGAPLIFRNQPVGCTATIIYHIYLEQQKTPPREIAGILLSAILSDTLMFRSATCTAEDRSAAEALSSIAGVDIKEYGEKMFKAGENLAGRTEEDIIFSDLKEFSFGDVRIAVGQSLFMTREVFLEAEKLLKPSLGRALKKTGSDILFYMLTYTPDKNTRLLICGEGAEELAISAFGREPVNGVVELANVVSRKKQLIPPIREAIKKQNEI